MPHAPADLTAEQRARLEQVLDVDLGGAGAPEAPAPGAPATVGDRVALLERLARLHFEGALSDGEFAVEKARLLGS